MTLRPRLFIAAAIVTVAAVAWLGVGVPLLVRMPDDLDVNNAYEGTFTTFVNPTNGDPLEGPITIPLTIDRHVYVVPGEVTSDNALVGDDITLRFADRVDEKTATYKIDRHSLENIPDARTSVTDDTGTYSVTLPFGADVDDTYRMWKAETATAYPLRHQTGPRFETIDGLRVMRMDAALEATPMTPEASAAIAEQGLPLSLTAEKVVSWLSAAGLDPKTADAVRAAIPADIPLTYSIATTATANAEPKSGVVVRVSDAVEQVTVAADEAAIAPVRAAISGSAPLLAALDRLTGSRPVYTLVYDQTPASIAARVDSARDAAGSIDLARRNIPAAIFTAAVLLALLGFVPRRTKQGAEERAAAAAGGPSRDLGKAA